MSLLLVPYPELPNARNHDTKLIRKNAILRLTNKLHVDTDREPHMRIHNMNDIVHRKQCL